METRMRIVKFLIALSVLTAMLAPTVLSGGFCLVNEGLCDVKRRYLEPSLGKFYRLISSSAGYIENRISLFETKCFDAEIDYQPIIMFYPWDCSSVTNPEYLSPELIPTKLELVHHLHVLKDRRFAL